MADRTPESNTDLADADPQPQPPPRPGRWARRIVLLLPTLGAVLGAWWLAGRWENLQVQHAPAPPARGDLAYTDTAPPTPTPTPAAWQTLLTQPMDADPLALNPARRPLDREPADLPPYPDRAEHESRFRLVDGSIVDEVSFWRVRGGASEGAAGGASGGASGGAAEAVAVADHYRAAAAAAGFTELRPPEKPETRPGQPAASNLLFVDDRYNARLLTVRIRPQESGCHALIWLRYGADPP